MNNLIIDVGASNLYLSNILAKKNPKCKILAIDPLIQANKSKYQNIITYNYAIDKSKKNKKFFIGGNFGDCSSLLEFDKSKIQPTKSLTVKSLPLSEIISKYDFQFIEYIQIDTQGNDLNVLESLGNKFSKIIYGNIEAPINKSNSLYVGQYDLYEALKFLNKKNFNIDKIIPNNIKCDEVNIFFSTKNKIKKKFIYNNYIVRGFNDFENLNLENYNIFHKFFNKISNKFV